MNITLFANNSNELLKAYLWVDDKNEMNEAGYCELDDSVLREMYPITKYALACFS